MEVYEIKFTENHKVSLVKDPAIESTLLKFSNETDEVLHFTNDEKKIVYSVAMIPNKLIFRKDVQGKPANVFYSAETIEKFQQDYFRTNANAGTNINHEAFNTEGIFPFESWIVGDDNRAELLGLDAPKGSLVMGFKIDNPDVWNEIKAGNLDGLSVEGNVEYEQKPTIKMSKLEKVTKFFTELFADEAQETEEEKAARLEAEALKMAEEEAAKNAAPLVNEPDYKAENEKLKEQVSLLEEKLAKIESDKVKAETDLVSMTTEFEKFKNETPASAAIQNVPPKVDFEKMTPLEKFRANK